MPSRNPCALGLLQTIHRNLANQPRLHSGRGFFRITFDNHPMSSHAGAPEPKLKVPPGQDEAAITTKVKELLAPNAETRTSWALVLDGAGLQRSFRFKTFNKTWAFMNAVAEQCKVRNHHPEWSNCYDSTTILWTTHRPKGLTVMDVDMATSCDEQARLHEEQAISG